MHVEVYVLCTYMYSSKASSHLTSRICVSEACRISCLLDSIVASLCLEKGVGVMGVGGGGGWC